MLDKLDFEKLKTEYQLLFAFFSKNVFISVFSFKVNSVMQLLYTVKMGLFTSHHIFKSFSLVLCISILKT